MDFKKIFSAEKPGNELKAWKKRMPLFLDTADKISAGPYPWHTGSVLDHVARCMNEVAGDPLAVWLAMCHDAGKLTTPKILLPHHYGHEIRGPLLTAIWARELGLPDDYNEAGKLIARWHMRAARYPNLRPGKKRWLLEKFPPAGQGEAFWKVVNADSHANISKLALMDWKNLN